MSPGTLLSPLLGVCYHLLVLTESVRCTGPEIRGTESNAVDKLEEHSVERNAQQSPLITIKQN